jgi:hypothetical protein
MLVAGICNISDGPCRSACYWYVPTTSDGHYHLPATSKYIAVQRERYILPSPKPRSKRSLLCNPYFFKVITPSECSIHGHFFPVNLIAVVQRERYILPSPKPRSKHSLLHNPYFFKVITPSECSIHGHFFPVNLIAVITYPWIASL